MLFEHLQNDVARIAEIAQDLQAQIQEVPFALGGIPGTMQQLATAITLLQTRQNAYRDGLQEPAPVEIPEEPPPVIPVIPVEDPIAAPVIPETPISPPEEVKKETPETPITSEEKPDEKTETTDTSGDGLPTSENAPHDESGKTE